MVGTTQWATISALATAAGTMVLAVATFASVRSGNRAARTAERQFAEGLRPLLFPSHLEDADQKMRWGDDHWAVVSGGGAILESADGEVYLAISLRNVGSGFGVIHSWHTEEVPEFGAATMARPSLDGFHPQSRDLFIPPGEVGYWQGAIRQGRDPAQPWVNDAIDDRHGLLVDVLYSDFEGGQRTVSRFLVLPRGDERTDWLSTVVRHWNLDRPDPRT
jgi:hypothetical protein